MPMMAQSEQKNPDTDVVYLTIRYRKQTIMFFCKEGDTISRVKEILQPLVKARPEDQRLFAGLNTTTTMEDSKRLTDYNITSSSARAQQPMELSLVLRQNGSFEQPDIVPYSTPPPLPDVMKDPQV